MMRASKEGAVRPIANGSYVIVKRDLHGMIILMVCSSSKNVSVGFQYKNDELGPAGYVRAGAGSRHSLVGYILIG